MFSSQQWIKYFVPDCASSLLEKWELSHIITCHPTEASPAHRVSLCTPPQGIWCENKTLYHNVIVSMFLQWHGLNKLPLIVIFIVRAALWKSPFRFPWRTTKVDPKSPLTFISLAATCNLCCAEAFSLRLLLLFIAIKRKMAKLLCQQQGNGKLAQNRKIKPRSGRSGRKVG